VVFKRTKRQRYMSNNNMCFVPVPYLNIIKVYVVETVESGATRLGRIRSDHSDPGSIVQLTKFLFEKFKFGVD
jgi:hypothetical protein